MEEDFTESGRTISAAERKHRQKRLINSRLLLEQAQSNIWEEMMLPNHDSFPEYIVAVVQFAYVTCFSTALPITPFIVLINHLLAMRLDAYKLCRGRRRPLAQKTGGIGVWEHVLHIVTVIAVFTNCTLMALTSSLFKWLGTKIGHIGLLLVAVGVSWGAHLGVACFAIVEVDNYIFCWLTCSSFLPYRFMLSIEKSQWEHLLLLIKYVMTQTISPYPQEVLDEQRREKYQASRQRNQNLRAKKDRRSGSLQNNGDKVQVRDRLRPTPSKSASKRNLGSLASVPEASPLLESSNNHVEGGDSTSESSPLLERSGEDNSFSIDRPGSLRRRHVGSSAGKMKRSPNRKSPHRSGRGGGGGGSVCSMYIQHDQISPSAPPISPETDMLSISDIVDDDVTMASLQASSNANTSSWLGYDTRERKRLEANLEAEARITERLSNVHKQSTSVCQSIRRRRRRNNQR